MKNVTLSMPEDLLAQSREYARRHGTSLNQLIRDLLRRNVKEDSKAGIKAMLDFVEKNPASTGEVYQWRRKDAYES